MYIKTEMKCKLPLIKTDIYVQLLDGRKLFEKWQQLRARLIGVVQ